MHRLLAALLTAMATTAADAAPAGHQMPRPDGSLIDYALDMPIGQPAGLIVLAQGSGCLPSALNANLDAVRAAFPAHIALSVEKYGIAPDTPIADGFTDCPPEFHAGHTVSQRVADYARVLGHLRGEGSVEGPLILFGGSEGGLAMAMLAARIKADAVILLSSGTGMGFAEMVRSTVPPEGHPTIDAGFAAARADPEGTTLFAGSSHRFWADIMEHRAADHMLASDTPFLLIQGGRDMSSPVMAARLTADLFAAEGKCTLTYWELPGLDHAMADPDGRSHLAGTLVRAAHWAESPPATC